jgi:hypothetical protein
MVGKERLGEIRHPVILIVRNFTYTNIAFLRINPKGWRI